MSIVYGKLTENDFKEFLEVLKQVDEAEYKEESKDGFVDLYNYWNEIYTYERSGPIRFYSKIAANKERI